jgi:hypothetical protein
MLFRRKASNHLDCSLFDEHVAEHVAREEFGEARAVIDVAFEGGFYTFSKAMDQRSRVDELQSTTYARGESAFNPRIDT